VNVPSLLVNVARPPADGDPLDVVRAILAAGADGVGLADSPRLFGDPWLEAGRALASTSSALAGPCTVSLGLRHPSSVAAAVRTLEGHHPGRALVVVGRGESSVRNEGLAVPTTAEHREALDLLAEQLRVEGERVAPGRVLGAASGPRSLVAAAAALGGVLVDVGVQPDVVRRAARVARDAAPGCRVWLFLRAVVTESEDESARAAAPLVGSCAARMVAAPSWYGLDDAALSAAREVASGHDYARHGTAGARGEGDEDDEALTAVRRRFVLAGDVATVASGARALAVAGVDGVVVAGAMAGVMDRLDELVPALRRGFSDRGDRP